MVSPKHHVLLYLPFVAVVLFSAILIFSGTLWTRGADLSHSVQVGNATPSVTNVVVNNGSAITLTANATTTVTVSFTVTDNNGCGEVFFSGNVTTTLFRSGVSTTCAVANPSINLNTLNCYAVATTTNNCPSAVSTTTSANATSTFEVWYFADATDSSSSYPTETWQSFVIAQDASSTTNSTTSAGVELNTLLALNVQTSTINYGTVNPGDNTSSTNQTVPIKNAGNASTTLSINGTAMTNGANSIPTSSQHYATSTFTYGGAEQALQSAATAVSGFLIARPPLTTWATTTPLPTGTYEHASVAYNGYVYTIGGSNATRTSTVLFAPINASGSIGNWSTTTALPTSTDSHASVVYNGYLYVIGGCTNVCPTSTVLFAPINATGSIGSWTTTTALQSSIWNHSAITYNNYVYSIGGQDVFFIRTSTVNFAPINATGSIGSWTTTTALPSALYDVGPIANNGYLYAVGGYDFDDTSTVNFAPINANGSLGTWTTTTALPQKTSRQTAVLNNGTIYVIGGANNSGVTETSTVYFTPIKASGFLGSWSRTAPLSTTGTMQHTSVVYNGYLYTIGGLVSGGSATSTVLYTSLASRNTYWGAANPAGTAQGVFTGQNTFTAVFSP